MNKKFNSFLIISVFTVSFILCCLNTVLANSEKEIKNGFYLELLGNGGLYSINYDRLFFDTISGRIGFTFLTLSGLGTEDPEDIKYIALPLMLNYLIGFDNHKLEFGAGSLFVLKSSGLGIDAIAEAGVRGTVTLGYRYQPQHHGWMFRVGLTPLFGNGHFSIWGGLSFGAVF